MAAVGSMMDCIKKSVQHLGRCCSGEGKDITYSTTSRRKSSMQPLGAEEEFATAARVPPVENLANFVGRGGLDGGIQKPGMEACA